MPALRHAAWLGVGEYRYRFGWNGRSASVFRRQSEPLAPPRESCPPFKTPAPTCEPGDVEDRLLRMFSATDRHRRRRAVVLSRPVTTPYTVLLILCRPHACPPSLPHSIEVSAAKPAGSSPCFSIPQATDPVVRVLRRPISMAGLRRHRPPPKPSVAPLIDRAAGATGATGATGGSVEQRAELRTPPSYQRGPCRSCRPATVVWKHG